MFIILVLQSTTNFRIQVEDYDPPPDSNDLVDRLILMQGQIRPSDGVREVTATGSFGKVTITAELSVECQNNYYGDNCYTYCAGRDDGSGHYGCDENGVRVCLGGYTGLPNCLDRKC